MARLARETIQTYMSVTGASESFAVQRLREHEGDLSGALDAHFTGLEMNTGNQGSGVFPQSSFANISSSMPSRQSRFSSLISAARAFRPSLLLNPSYRRDLRNQLGDIASPGWSPIAANTAEATGYHVESAPRGGGSHHSGIGQGFDTSARTPLGQGSGVHSNTLGDGSYLHNECAEEQMIQIAIDASRKDAEEHSGGFPLEQAHRLEDEDLARALSLSLQSMELEEAMREQVLELERHNVPVNDHGGFETSENATFQAGSSSAHDRQKKVTLKQAASLNVSHDRNQQYKGHSCPKEDSETQLAKKAPLCPRELIPENEEPVSLLIRLPDGRRYCGHFLRSDKLQCLFDFIDASGTLRTSSYRLVRPYPRSALSVEDATRSLYEVGLTNKQEALYLEFI